MQIKTITSYYPDDKKVNEFINGKNIIDIKTNVTFCPRHMYADGRGCDGEILYVYTILYKE